MRWWKIAGLAAFVGVAATGAVVARDQRRRHAYTSEQIRERLHARLAEAEAAAGDQADVEAEGTPGRSPGAFPHRA